MTTLDAVFLCLGSAILLALATRRLAVPYPSILVLGGLAVAMIPGIPVLAIEPQVILSIFLPPVLFEAASRLSRRDMRANAVPAGILALLLVAATCAAVAALAIWLFPGIPLPVAIVIGAIVAPADSVSSEAVLTRLKVSRRVITTLAGEGLVNDTISVVVYKLAVGAVLASAVSLPGAVLEFVLSIGGGAVFGIAIGWIGVRLLRACGEHVTYTLLSLMLAFVTYIIAERIGLSGPVATVAAGVVRAVLTPETVSAELRFNAGVTWEVVIFALSALGFLLIGVQLPAVIDGLKFYSTGELALYAAAAIVAVVVTRFLLVIAWASAGRFFPRRTVRLSWRDDIVIGWSGMRGLVSLAAALALPPTPEGSVFPYRDLALFFSFAVILFTLVAQGLSLAAMVRILHAGHDGSEEEARLGRIEAAEAALEVLDLLAEQGAAGGAGLDALRGEYLSHLSRLRVRPDSAAADEYPLDEVRLKLIDAARRRLLRLNHSRRIGDDVLRELLSELDIAEITLGRRSGNVPISANPASS